MKIEVLPALCRCHKKCSRICPEVFAHDENGFAWIRPGRQPVPPEEEARARKAVYACPSKALLISTG